MSAVLEMFPESTKLCQKRLHEIPISTERCMECRRTYTKKYRENHLDELITRDRERYKKEHPNYKPNSNVLKRQEAIDLYYTDPKSCKECGEMIHVRPKEKISQLKKRQFCDRKCSSAFAKRKQKTGRHCSKCGELFTVTDEHTSRHRCSKCSKGKRANNIGKSTKGEMFARRSSWQSARSSIRRDADTKYRSSGRPRSCAVCGYSRYIEVAHIKEVKSFPSTALISEINHIDNLVAMCRNHHWEIDHGFLRFNAGCFEEVTTRSKNMTKPRRTHESASDQRKLFPIGAELSLTI